jgi:hypothetical protein
VTVESPYCIVHLHFFPRPKADGKKADDVAGCVENLLRIPPGRGIVFP